MLTQCGTLILSFVLDRQLNQSSMMTGDASLLLTIYPLRMFDSPLPPCTSGGGLSFI